MSKEMLVIALGAWIIVVRLLLGIPGSWQTVLFVLSGVVLVVIGFLLRGEAISRQSAPRATGNRSYSFVENAPEPATTHEQSQGITSLN